VAAALKIASLAAAALALAQPAAAQSCGSEIARLAGQFDLPPAAAPHGAAELPQPPSEPPASIAQGGNAALGASSGVTSPPDTVAPAPMQPPAAATAGRNAAPREGDTVPPQGAAVPSLTAAQRSRMTALLQQARAAERKGNDAECLQRLREAAAVPHPPTAQ